jgi:hypothetical protein
MTDLGTIGFGNSLPLAHSGTNEEKLRNSEDGHAPGQDGRAQGRDRVDRTLSLTCSVQFAINYDRRKRQY